MFFVLSKTIGLFAVPSNDLIFIGLIGLVLLCTRFRRLASWLIVTSIVLIAFVGFSPLGRLLILPLEQRFPAWNPSRGPPDGIIVLGGAISPDISLARGVVALGAGAEARIIFSGGTGSLFGGAVEAPYAVKEFEALGIAHDRITAEEQSRNTIENAVFSRLLAQPKPGEHWLLVTSGYHMPRAMAAFRAAGFAVEACPVDWHARTDRRDRAVPVVDRRPRDDRRGPPRMDWPDCLSARRQNRSAIP
jgi:uncharacterized SAM-binding protein YcdF (DUF218 family)